jgi:two-component system sensor histidine kinase RegB
MVLGSRWAWSIVMASVAGYGALFLLPASGSVEAHAHHGGSPMHLQGMWLAFAVTASLITSFVTRIASELRTREREVERLSLQAARSDKLASLSTLAAGAAHELGTPLSTIALVAKELERALARQEPVDPRQVEDARLIRGEVERCREILQQLSSDAGQTLGEKVEPVALGELSRMLGESLTATERGRVHLQLGDGSAAARVPPRSLVQALRNLVRNGLDASTGDVTVALAKVGDRLRVRVQDTGPGMQPEVLARAGEPFFTTKEPGRGMGLGLFLARAVAEKLGGSLQLDSTAAGTIATLELPQEAA